MAGDNHRDFVLGIDLGTNSLGWAVLERAGGAPVCVRAAGARVFESAMDGDAESGNEESRNKARRDARHQRRQAWRRSRRRKKVFRLLQQYDLLPAGEASTPEQRQTVLNELDNAIRAAAWFAGKAASGAVAAPDQVLPYLLRAAALDGPLEPHFFGRALYHLTQRRGFLSNRRESSTSKKKDKDDDEGKVASGISGLRKQMQDSGARTLGEFFSRLNPHEARIRTRYTHRTMYETEFNEVWQAQARHRPDLLTEDRRKQLYKALFFQRPLWFPRGLVGRCELEQEERRAPAYLLVSQRFRLLQTVNNLKVLPPREVERPLTAEERTKLIEALEEHGNLEFSKIRTLLGLSRNHKFNLEAGGEKKIPGNRTASKFRAVFGPRWLSMSEAERDRAVAYVHGFQRPDKLDLDRVAKKYDWDLDPPSAEKLVEIALEEGHLNHSLKAMQKLLPLMKSGSSYSDARKQEYPHIFESKDPLPLLPPVVEGLSEVRNPAVTRSLTELRKVVNAVIRAHGKPAEIRIELARDLRKSKKQRENTWKRGRENQNTREAARKKLIGWGLPKPSRDDITKFMLAEECGWKCPYTGRTISMDSLFGAHPQFDLEHILPFSRSLDNSFVNLTLCHADENRNVKHNRTPFEAYSADTERYREILARVKQFRSHVAREKLRRFKMTPEEVAKHLQDFSARQLNDTRYASRLAADYLALLYGGRVDASGKRRIRSSAGQVTADLRNEWKLNSILRDGPTSDGGSKPKSRDDHRHHAVDAVVIALTDDGTIAQLSRAAELAPQERRRRYASLQAPWNNFVDSIRAVIDGIVVSHRVSRKVSGALHEETFYSRPMPARSEAAKKKNKKGVGEETRHVRKLLASLTYNEAEKIVDDAVRRLVLEKLKALGASEPKKVFSDEKNLPFLKAADGSRIPIKRVRVKKAVPAFVVGSGPSTRHVTSESNHHVEIFAELDESGAEVRWEGAVVSMIEAYRRKCARGPVVKRDHGPATPFKFSLSKGETVECNENGSRCCFVVRKFSQNAQGQIQIGLLPLNEARKLGTKKEQDASKNVAVLWLPGPDALRKASTRKVAISPLGEVTEAHD